MPERASKVSASYVFQKGNYILSQGATKINMGSFATEGSVKLETVKLFGGFSYQKTLEDSTRFAHQTRSNLSTPFYYGSPGYVHYERSVYAFKAMASKNFLNEKLDVALGTDYKVGDHFSTNDPRGSVGEYQFNLMASLGYRISDRLKAGVAYHYGYGRESVNVGYRNPRYYESSTYPMYYNHLINGYGEGEPSLTVRQYDDKQRRNGFDLYLDVITETLGDFYLNGGYTTENQRYFNSKADGFTEYALYDLNTTAINMLWQKKLNSSSVGVLINYNSQEGRDLHMKFAVNNYFYISHVALAKFFLATAGKKRNYTHYISIKNDNQERGDGITGNHIYFNNLLLTAGSGFKNNYADHSFFGLNLGLNYQLPLNDTFKVTESTEGYFTRYVIYHDYLYHTSSAIGGQMNAEYGKPVFKNMLVSLKIDLNYQQKLDEKSLDRTLSSRPGKDCFWSAFSLNLYF